MVGMATTNTYSLPPRLLSFLNAEAWDNQLKDVLSMALEALGVSNESIKAELSALHVQGVGGGIVNQSCSMCSAPVWGFLEIELPAVREGGSLVFSYGDDDMRFTYSGSAAVSGKCHWTAFFGACKRELEVITSGRRLSLVYALSCAEDSAGPLPSPPSMANHSRQFEQLERRWVANKDGDAPQRLVYFLENAADHHDSWNHLTSSDAAMVQALLDAQDGGESVFDMFLASFSLCVIDLVKCFLDMPRTEFLCQWRVAGACACAPLAQD